MINYLEKYNELPKDLRDKISAPHVMRYIHDMETKYSVNLAGVVMRVVVKDLKVDELQNFFVYTIGITADKAVLLIKELKAKVFSEIANYLDYINNEEDRIVVESNNVEDENDPIMETEGVDPVDNHGGADFYFSIEDEDEVRQQAQDFSHLDKREEIANQVEAKIGDVIAQINVIFSSEDMLHRLKMVLRTYLRGVRDPIDTRLALERKIENGGLGLDEEIADDVLKIVDVINKDERAHPGRMIKPKKITVPEDLQTNDAVDENISIGGDVAYDFNQIDKLKEIKEIVEGDSSEEEVVKEVISEESATEIDSHEEDGVDDKKEKVISKDKDLVLDLSADEKKEKKEETAEKEEKFEDKSGDNKKVDVDAFSTGMIAKARNKRPLNMEEQKISAKQFGDMAGKVKMEDIKKVAKLGGPLEELGAMNLVDFRRMSKDANESVTKLTRMFELLEEESFNKKMSGIKLWRKSPLNKLYLKLGQESIIQQKDIKQVIELRKKDKKDYLSPDEFDAIMELNAKLRY